MIERGRWVLWLTAALLVPSCAARRDEVRVMDDGVRFQLRRPAASSAAVAGDFNGWSQDAHPMMRSGDTWSAVIRLPPGEYLFMYVVDGIWMTPPNVAEIVPDGFGGSNGRIVVP